MAYYFNLGVDAEIGLQVERQRSKYRCCNYLSYISFFLYTYIFRRGSLDVRQSVKRISSTKKLRNGLEKEKVLSEVQ
jgi:hypothetical protein